MKVPTASEVARLSRPDREALLLQGWDLLQGANLDLLGWSVLHRLEDDAPLDFEAFPFQREIYRAFGDKGLASVEVMKSSQCGISAAAVSLALYAADAWGAHVLYVLPTESLAETFSDTRVKTAIESSPYLRSRLSATDSKGLKRLGAGNLHFVGSGSEARALSVPADVLVLDEFDRLDQRQVAKFPSRLAAPTSLNLLRRFSNPSYPEAGIHRLWMASDQRTWLITCPACGTEAPIAYDQGPGHYVDEDRELRVCGGCHRALPLEAIAAGQWVPARADRDHRAYHVSRLIVPGERVAELVEHHAQGGEEEVAVHYNFDLGLPYAPKGGSLDRELVLACRRGYVTPNGYRGSQWVTAGVDVGKELHVRISRWLDSEKAAPLFVGQVGDFEHLGLLWESYAVNFGLIDERPEERQAREFAGRFPGRGALIRWAGEAQQEEYVYRSDTRLVIARRTWALDRTVAAVAAQHRLLPRDLPKGYVQHMTAPHRITDTTASGQKVGRYVSERADDYFFAETYDLLARLVRSEPSMVSAVVDPEPLRRTLFPKRRL